MSRPRAITIVGIGDDKDAKLLPLRYSIDHGDRIEGIPVTQVVGGLAEFHEAAAHRKQT